MSLALLILLLPWVITYNFISPKGVSSYKNNTAQREVLKGLLWNEEGRATGGIDIRPELLPDRIKEYNKNPKAFAKLMFRKLKVFWWIFHPQMTLRHKIANSLLLIPLYILALIGLLFSRNIWEKSSLLVLTMLAFTLSSMLGIVDYDLRYHLPVALLCNVLSGYGAVIIVDRFLIKNAKT